MLLVLEQIAWPSLERARWEVGCERAMRSGDELVGDSSQDSPVIEATITVAPVFSMQGSVARWLLRRVLVAFLQLFCVSVAVFGAMHLTPGRPEEILLGANPSTPGALEAIRERYGLNGSLPSQYFSWLWSAARLDFGQSIRTSQPVADAIRDCLGVTTFLAFYALLLVVLIAVPLGLVAGAMPGSVRDRIITIATTVGVSAPSFAVGTFLLYVFGIALGIFPVYGTGTGFLDRLWHLTLPAVTLATTVIALITRQTRASAMTVCDQDFMTFARARGLPQRLIWRRYLLLNSSLPVATSIGLVVAYFLTGAVIVEATFSLPGVGSLMIQSINSKDIPVVQGVCMLTAVLVLTINLLADLSYAVLDPRLRKKMFG